VLLTGRSNVERWSVDQLGSNTNVALTNQDTGVVNALGKSLFVHLGLETSLQQFLSRQLKDEIQFELIVGKETITLHSAHEGSSLEHSLGVLGIEGKKGTGSLSELGKSILDTPDFTLASKAVLSDELEFGVEAFLFVWATGCLEGLTV
jgi:hypothetical protein